MGQVFLLELSHVGRRINSEFYLEDNNLQLSAGEVVAIIGKNASGKSSLFAALMGVLPIESGQVSMDGQPIQILTPTDATTRGIMLLGQNQPMFDNMRVYENIYFGQELTIQGRGGLLDDRRMREEARGLFQRMEMRIDVLARLNQLNHAQRQLVGLARAIATGGRLLLLDEPSTHLNAVEKQEFWNAIKALKKQGRSVLLVSHDPKEVLATADRLAVMDKGTLGEPRPVAGMTEKEIIESAYEIKAADLYHRERAKPENTVLATSHLSGGEFTDVTFSLRGGEVVALCGGAGSGARALLRALGGFEYKLLGSMRGREKVIPGQPMSALEQGISLAMGEEEEAIIRECEQLLRKGKKYTLLTRAQLGMALLGVGFSQMFGGWVGMRGAPKEHITGGNRRRELMERVISRKAKVFLLCDPTAGMDVLARMRLYERLGRLALSGACILMLTNSLEEAFGFCDRLMILKNGKLVLDAPIPQDEDNSSLRSRAEELTNEK